MKGKAMASVFTCAVISLLSSVIHADDPRDKGQPPNLLPNASFETDAGGKPAKWQTFTWGGRGEFEYAQMGRTGQRSVMISSTKGADAGWHTTVPVRPNSTCRLSGWIKVQDVATVKGGRGALLNLHNIQPVATKALTGTQDWTRVETVFDTGNRDTVQVNCLFGGWGLATGRAWYDDLRVEIISTKDWQPAIVIDASQRSEPVSKYIYGQFIEHLGRCIYGGIWAEMIEDRKFFFPITPAYNPYPTGRKDAKDARFPVVGASPWQIVGPDGSVRMVREDSFVGDHTPLIAAGGGIRQNDLGVIKGKQYSGYVWLKAAKGSPAVTVGFSPAGDPVKIAEVGKQYTRHPLNFTASETTDKSSLTITVEGGDCYVGTLSLMPADNVEGMRADTLDLLKQLNSPVYRWPGGNFVSGYDWKDGVGDRDRRPPRKNPAWTGVEHNDFGLDEFMAFCRILETEPYVAVNSGLGQVNSAVEQLQYANGTTDTPMGKWRAKNGHAKPYAVKWWGIGNEMYGGWQLGHMPLEAYIKKHNQFAAAMRAEDPEITLVAVGATGRWSEGMMQQCADHMDLISEHFYRRDQPGLSSHVAQLSDAVRQKAEAHRDYRRRFDSLKGKDIDIALDEWNYWYGPHVFGELGTRYFLKDALGVAAAIHEYTRQSDIMFMANYAQTVNVIGCIKTSKTHASFAATGLALKLYRDHYGTIPLAVTTQSPLDAAAALSEDGKTLTIGVINPTMTALNLPLSINGAHISGNGKRWQIGGTDPMAYNEPGQTARVQIEESEIQDVKDRLAVAPCSVTLFALELK
jgi:alpha-N-arabinofuranosidase